MNTTTCRRHSFCTTEALAEICGRRREREGGGGLQPRLEHTHTTLGKLRGKHTWAVVPAITYRRRRKKGERCIPFKPWKGLGEHGCPAKSDGEVDGPLPLACVS